MMYFWVIPFVILVAVAIAYFFRGTKRTHVGTSRLDDAIEQERQERDLRE